MTENTRLAGETPVSGQRLHLRLALSVFLPFAAGYYLSYLFRTVNAIIAPNLAADAGLSASDLGLLTSMYFLSFAALQLPLGLLLDRYGPKRVEAVLLCFAAAGALLFALSDDLPGLAAGRALVGIGVSCCMMAAFKAFVMWFPPARLPLVNGCLLTCGALGAISATAPVEWLLGFSDWRALFVGLAVISAVVAITVLTTAPDHPEPPLHTRFADQIGGLGQVLRDRHFWRIAPLAALTSGSSMAVHTLWAGPWLRDVADLGRDAVAEHLLILATSLGVGFFTMGLAAERLGRLGVRPVRIAAGGMGGFTAVLSLLAAGGFQPGLWILLAAFGFLSTSSTLTYAVLSQHFPRQLAGRANTAQNLLVFTAAFALQWGIGGILGHWEDPVSQHYAPQGYRVALGSVAALQALALLWYLLSPAGRRAGGTPR